MSRIFWDTNLFIYLLEDYGTLSGRVVEIRNRMVSRNDQLYTSTLTLGEILVKPRETNDESGIRRLIETLNSLAVLIPFDQDVAQIYASVRQDRSIKAPDAIQLACAAAAQVDLFITNDNRLSRKSIAGIHFVTSLENAYL
jgi:predicted nucleic acid-binding protein